jgi:hypothetical protein
MLQSSNIRKWHYKIKIVFTKKKISDRIQKTFAAMHFAVICLAVCNLKIKIYSPLYCMVVKLGL